MHRDVREFIGVHPLFHLEYVIPCNNSNARRQLVKEAATKIFLDWLTKHQQCYLLHYVKASDSFTVLHHLVQHVSFQEHLGETCKTNIQCMFHTFITKYKKSHCCWAAKEESKFWYGKGKLFFEGEFKIGALTQLDVTALQKSRDGQFSYDKKSERKDLFGSPARNSAPGPWCHDLNRDNGADQNTSTGITRRFIGSGEDYEKKG